MTTFIGDYPCKLDAKGRFVMPAAFIRQMSSQEGKEMKFVMKKDIFEKCLVLYSIEEWERQNELIRSKINPYNKEHTLFLRGFYKDTAEIIMDASNRLVMPKRLMELAEIETDLFLSGQDRKIEIWAKSLYEKTNQNEEDFANLAQKILGDLS